MTSNSSLRPSVSALAPGSTIGILGGGQLGRMLAQAAAELGFHVHIYCPEANPPAKETAAKHIHAAYDDEQALNDFAASVDRVTYEFENIPGQTAEILANSVGVFPSPKALDISQDRLTEKNFIHDLGIEVAPFHDIKSKDEIAKYAASFGGEAILKTRRLGYDGKGQWRIKADTDIDEIWSTLNGQASIVEAVIPFSKEISVIVARSIDKSISCYDPAENIHENHILRTSKVPANVPSALHDQAMTVASTIAGALDYIGVLAIELFVTETRLIVNEIAPRVHNSGHWTMDACQTSQFTQHIRAVAGWPLGSPERHCEVEMTNIIGEEVQNWLEWANKPDHHLHLYGKHEARAGRKMGHVNRLITD